MEQLTPKEKAEQLVKDFEKLIKTTLVVSNNKSIKKFCAKQCALIAVDEILKNQYDHTPKAFDKYWQEVRNEIERL